MSLSDGSRMVFEGDVTRSLFQMMGHLGWHAPDGLDAEFAEKT
jgi:hypothetical protein